MRMIKRVSGRAKEIVLKVDWAWRFRFSAMSGFLMIMVLDKLPNIPRDGLVTPTSF